jgi:hypothetical protein
VLDYLLDKFIGKRKDRLKATVTRKKTFFPSFFCLFNNVLDVCLGLEKKANKEVSDRIESPTIIHLTASKHTTHIRAI